MPEDSFYLQCPSNSSMNIFKNNTLANYTVNLDSALELSEDYEVGLAELQYPQSWDNIRRGSNKIKIAYTHKQMGKFDILEKEVPAGYYHSVPELIAVIMDIYKTTRKERITLDGLEMKYNPTTRRVFISTDNMKLRILRANGKIHTPKVQSAAIELYDDVARLLGFKNKTIIDTGKTMESEFAATPSGGFHQMYLYTDIIYPQPHPDGNVSILRTIAIEGAPNREYLSKRFQKIYYMPLLKRTITTIEFKIMDDIGKLVGFDYGKVIVILHFRRKGYK